MKISGHTIKLDSTTLLVIPKGDQDIALTIKSADMDKFESLCPAPEPPEMIKRGVGRVKNVEDPDFVKKVEVYSERRVEWMVIDGLSATPDLVLETVVIEDASTWKNWKTEFEAAGFTNSECGRVVHAVISANGLSDAKFDEAKARFLASQQEEAKPQ